MIRDRDLLREYVRNDSEPAFAALVERHINMVYSTALRHSNNRQTAADITQTVFIALARNAASIRNPDALSGWLFRTTRLTAARFARSEMRRRNNELAAMAANLNEHPNEAAPWETIADHIDEAIATLNRADQDALALRFFAHKTMRQIGEALDLSEDAAQKRISRALEKLRGFLQARGLIISTATLATTLTANAVQAAPPGLAASAGSVAIAAAAAQSAVPWTLFLMSVKAKLAVASLLALAAITTTIAIRSRHRAQSTTPTTALPVQNSSTATTQPNQSNGAPATRPLNEIVAALQSLLSEPNLARRYSAILELAASVALEDIPAAIATAEKIPDSRLHSPFISLLLTRLAQTDPKSAIASAQRLSNTASITDGLRTVLDTWVEKDRVAVMAWAREIPRNDQWASSTLRSQVISALAAADPIATLDSLNSGALTLPGRKSDWYATIFQGWAARDVTSALATAAALPKGELQSRSLAAVLGAWTQRDPAAAACYLDQSAATPLRRELIPQIATAWRDLDPARAMEWAQSLSAKSDREQAASYIIKGLAARDPSAAAAFLDSGDRFQPGYAMPWRTVAEEWAKTDVDAAIKWTEKIPDAKLRSAAFASLVTTWAEHDPKAAASFALTLPDENDPLAPRTYRGHTDKQHAIAEIVQQWSAADPRAALKWIQQLPAAEQGTHTQTAADTWARTNPKEAAEFIVTEMPHGESQRDAALKVASAWSESDPSAAAQWVLEFPDDAARERVLSRVVGAWATNDVINAERFLLATPVEKLPTETVATFIVAANVADPTIARKWLPKIPPGAKRDALNNLISPP